jgi:putative ubiquitin-RnfH superfamily antitoxin RatB of RatAB toxin-antitoxin module
MARVEELRVSVAFSPRAGEVDVVELLLPAGATVADALRESGMQARHPGHALEKLPVGIWGAFCERTDLLRDRDRVEVYRPLLVDPKEARRQRQRAQRGLRRSG